MANMYELLQLAALQQQQQRQRLAELEEQDREEGEELPVALPLQTKMATLQDSSEYWKDKRGSCKYKHKGLNGFLSLQSGCNKPWTWTLHVERVKHALRPHIPSPFQQYPISLQILVTKRVHYTK